jgi:hypothetical protein
MLEAILILNMDSHFHGNDPEKRLTKQTQSGLSFPRF